MRVYFSNRLTGANILLRWKLLFCSWLWAVVSASAGHHFFRPPLSNLRLAGVIRLCNGLFNFPSLPLAVKRDDERSYVGERLARIACDYE
jgi:hypothetical protein